MEAEAGMRDYVSDFVDEPEAQMDAWVGREEFLTTIDMLFDRIKEYVDERDAQTTTWVGEKVLPLIDTAFEAVNTRLSDLEMRDGTTDAYRAWLISEAQRLGIKPSEVVKK